MPDDLALLETQHPQEGGVRVDDGEAGHLGVRDEHGHARLLDCLDEAAAALLQPTEVTLDGRLTGTFVIRHEVSNLLGRYRSPPLARSEARRVLNNPVPPVRPMSGPG